MTINQTLKDRYNKSMIPVIITGSDLKSRLEHSNEILINPPLFTIDGVEESIKISQIRNFQQQLNLAPTSNNIQYYFIKELQSAGIPAQNALLKTLEEPPETAQIIITADRPNSLLTTILSRCQIKPLKQSIILDSQRQQELIKLLNQISHSNYSQLISLAQTQSKSHQINSTIEQLIHLLQSSLFQKPTPNRSSAIKSLQICYTELNSTNINRQLSLEHLFFQLKQI